MKLAEKLTVRFSVEVSVHESDGMRILVKKGRKQKFFERQFPGSKIASDSHSANSNGMRNGFAVRAAQF